MLHIVPSFPCEVGRVSLFLPVHTDLQGWLLAGTEAMQEGMPSSVTGEPRPPPGMIRVKLWGGISCARHPLPTPSPLPAHPAPFSSLLPGSCLAFPFQFWALTLSFSWKIRHMENDAPRPKESISFASVACGLENSGAELLDSLVCLLPHSHSGPLVGGDFVHHLPSPPSASSQLCLDS